MSTVKGEPGTPATARLSEKDNVDKYVIFRYNPSKITIGHGSVTKTVNRAVTKVDKKKADTPAVESKAEAKVGDAGDVVTEAGDTVIGFDKVLLDGLDVFDNCKQLLEWTYPTEVPGIGINKAPNVILPELDFFWGTFVLGVPFKPTCIVLTKVGIEYSRFTQEGKPTRASVTIEAKVRVSKLPRQNPTSGGEPDRSGHRVIDGQNIQGIARQSYGDPRRWRELADANGIDDPLRLRAGDMLYLPNPGELGRLPR